MAGSSGGAPAGGSGGAPKGGSGGASAGGSGGILVVQLLKTGCFILLQMVIFSM